MTASAARDDMSWDKIGHVGAADSSEAVWSGATTTSSVTKVDHGGPGATDGGADIEAQRCFIGTPGAHDADLLEEGLMSESVSDAAAQTPFRPWECAEGHSGPLATTRRGRTRLRRVTRRRSPALRRRLAVSRLATSPEVVGPRDDAHHALGSASACPRKGRLVIIDIVALRSAQAQLEAVFMDTAKGGGAFNAR